MKKFLAFFMSICMLMSAFPVLSAVAETAEDAALSYIFANDLASNADGVIKYNGTLTAEEITSASLYWADKNGSPLEGYLAFAETDGGTIISGYPITGNKLIPKNAATVAIELITDDSTAYEIVSIPAEKQNTDRDDVYSMFFISDTHINHAMEAADNENRPVMGKESMIKRFDMLSEMMDSLTAEGDNVIGVSVIGDVVQGASLGDNLWLADEYDYTYAETVLSESVLESSYPVWYINGNHDTTEGVNHDGSAWVNFLDSKVSLVNDSIENSTYPENVLSAIEPISKEEGVYWYDTYIEGYHYIYLSAPYGGFKVGEEQLVWLEELLQEDSKTNKPTFVMGHFPVAGTVSTATGATNAMENSADLQAILNKYPNVIYLSGHTHANFLWDPVCLMMGDNTPTYINTGCFHRVEKPEITYISEGIYCRVYEDRIEFEARHFYNYTDSTEGYWIPAASFVLNLKNSTGDMEVEIVSSSEDIITGSSLTAVMNGKAIDTSVYDCRWYIGNAYVSDTASYTVTALCGTDNSITVPSGTVSLKVTDKSDPTKYVWVYAASQSESCIPIYTAEELAKIGIDEGYPLDGKYALMADIDLSSYGDWTPIGNDYSLGGFTGLFDGNGHTIKGLTVNADELTPSLSQVYGGLFNHLIGATVRNLTVKDAAISAGLSGYQAFAGVIAGDVEASSSGKATVISNVAVIDSTVTITAAYNNVCGAGAFIGSSNKRYTSNRAGGAIFTDCYSNSDITVNFNGTQSCAGGFIGYVYATKIPCEITDSIFDGTVTGHAGGNTRIGGFFGKAVNDDTVVTNSYSNSDKYTEKAAETSIYPVSGTMLTTDALTASTVTSLGLSDKWINSDIGPILKLCEYELLYADYIAVSSGAELAKIGVDEGYPLDGKYILTNDIDLSSYESWTPIGDINNTDDRTADTPNIFWGTLDGNGHTIKNLTINWTEASGTQIFVGLFSATRGADVKNIVFENVNITAGVSSAQIFAGVVAGGAEASNSGKASEYSDIYITDATLTVTASTNAVGVASFAGTTNKRSSSNTVGGAKITNCYSDADIINRKSNGQSCAGGFVGYGYATKSGGTGLEFTDSIFAGTITCTGATHWCGSIAGRVTANTAFTVTDVYCNPEISNTASTDSYTVITGTDYNSESSVEALSFTNTCWYNTPTGAKHRLRLINGDIDGNRLIEANDLAYLRQYLLGLDISADSSAADANADGVNNILDLVRIKNILADK